MARNRALLAVLCVALVLLAGCAGLGDGDATSDGTETVTTNGTATPTTTEAPNDTDGGSLDELPPGISEDGVEDAGALIDAHAAALADEGAVTRTNVSIESQNGAIDANTTATFGADGSIDAETVQSIGAGTFEVYQYTNGSVSAVRQVTPNAERRSVFSAGGYVERQSGARSIQPYVEIGNFSVAETGDGTVTLTADGVDETAGEDAGPRSNVTAYEGRMVVDEQGRILSFEATATVVSQGTETDIQISYEVTETGVESAERPAWVDDALAEETIPQLRYERTDGAIAITNEGDEPIPSGTAITVAQSTGVGADTDQYVAQLEDSLEPGETVYVYRGDETAIQGSVSAEAPGSDATAPVEGEVQIIVQGQGGIVDATTLSADDDEDE